VYTGFVEISIAENFSNCEPIALFPLSVNQL